MCGRPTNFSPLGDMEKTCFSWRKMQVRQAFRLALEALFYWTMGVLDGGPRSTAALVTTFMFQVPNRKDLTTAAEWLAAGTDIRSPTDAMDALKTAMEKLDDKGLGPARK